MIGLSLVILVWLDDVFGFDCCFSFDVWAGDYLFADWLIWFYLLCV